MERSSRSLTLAAPRGGIQRLRPRGRR